MKKKTRKKERRGTAASRLKPKKTDRPARAQAKPSSPAPQTKPKSSSRAGFRFLEHTADIMVLAWGGDFLSALEQAALAMFSVMGAARPKESFEVEEQARSRGDLVVYLLARILGECDAHELVPARIEVLRYEEGASRILARVWGERIRPKDAIKAVTYHRLEVKEEKGKCTIQVVFDV